MSKGNPLRPIVLVVDDSPAIRFLVRDVLKDMGVKEIRMASDGLTALEAMSEPVPDLMIFDYQMEPINGIELVRKVRTESDEPIKNVPIMMLTGHADCEIVEEAVKTGANDFLAKPIVRKLLQKRVERILKNAEG